MMAKTQLDLLQDAQRLVIGTQRRLRQVLVGKQIPLSPEMGLILARLGEERISIRELTQRGYYLGSNASYNLQRLTELGYLARDVSMHDRRLVHVAATAEGRAIGVLVMETLVRHFAEVAAEPQRRSRLRRAGGAAAGQGVVISLPPMPLSGALRRA